MKSTPVVQPRINLILAQPAHPGVFRICPKCRAWFSMVLISARLSDSQGTISEYRCRNCEITAEFAERHPSNAV